MFEIEFLSYLLTENFLIWLHELKSEKLLLFLSILIFYFQWVSFEKYCPKNSHNCTRTLRICDKYIFKETPYDQCLKCVSKSS